jgi:hypothetical protein
MGGITANGLQLTDGRGLPPLKLSQRTAVWLSDSLSMGTVTHDGG